MSYDPKFEAEYTRMFAVSIRSGASSSVLHNYCERIDKALAEITDSKLRSEAHSRLHTIGRYGFILIEDPEGGRQHIANEIFKFADFLEKIK